MVEAKGLDFSYGEKSVLLGLDLCITRGEVVCILGPNGVGKTTLVETLLGSLKPNGGSVRVFGLDPRRADAKFWTKIGLVQQNWSDHPKWRVLDQLEWIKALYGIGGGNTRTVDEVLAAVGLEDKATTRMSRLSGGQRRTVDFAAALIGQPDLLILDEPTTGLDPMSKGRIHDLIMERVDSDATVLMTTHDLAEAERLATRVVVISGGRFVADGTVTQLQDQFSDTAQVSWIAEGKRFVHATDTPEKFLQTMELNSISHLTVSRPTLEDTYFSIIQEASQ